MCARALGFFRGGKRLGAPFGETEPATTPIAELPFASRDVATGTVTGTGENHAALRPRRLFGGAHSGHLSTPNSVALHGQKVGVMTVTASVLSLVSAGNENSARSAADSGRVTRVAREA
jgi:hypothetical protein